MKKIILTFSLALAMFAPVYVLAASGGVGSTTTPSTTTPSTTTPSTTTPSTTSPSTVGTTTPAPTSTSTDCSYDKNSTQLCNPISGANDLNSLIIKGLRYMLGLIGTVAVVMIVWAGFQMVSSQGNEGQVKRAKGTITWSVIGLVVAFLAYTIVSIVQNVLINAK